MRNNRGEQEHAELIRGSKKINQLTEDIIGAAIEVHKSLGPGLLESAYETCLAYERELRHISYARNGKGRSSPCP